MSLREFPAHMYRVPDLGDTRIADLERELARLRAEITWYRAFYLAARAQLRVLAPRRRRRA